MIDQYAKLITKYVTLAYENGMEVVIKQPLVPCFKDRTFLEMKFVKDKIYHTWCFHSLTEVDDTFINKYYEKIKAQFEIK